MGQQVTALLVGLRDENVLDKFCVEDAYLWEPEIDSYHPDSPFLSAERDAVGYCVAVDAGRYDGEGDLSAHTIPFGDLSAVERLFPAELARARSQWDHLARVLARKGMKLDPPALLLTTVAHR